MSLTVERSMIIKMGKGPMNLRVSVLGVSLIGLGIESQDSIGTRTNVPVFLESF